MVNETAIFRPAGCDPVHDVPAASPRIALPDRCAVSGPMRSATVPHRMIRAAPRPSGPMPQAATAAVQSVVCG